MSSLNLNDLSESGQPDDSSLSVSDQKQFVAAVYRQVWEEFYDWELKECQGQINLLQRHPPEFPEYVVDWRAEYFESNAMQVDSESPDSIAIAIYDEHGSEIHCSYTSCEDFKVEIFDPHPSYEFCTPVNGNIAEYSEEQVHIAQFIPFADDPRFKSKEYLEQFEGFKWQIDFHDPDLEVIQLETARRLLYDNDTPLDYKDIDRSGILRDGADNLRKVRDHIIMDTYRRDFFSWSGTGLSDLPELSRYDIPKNNNLEDQVNSSLTIFCPNLNCLHSKCNTHRTPYPPLDPIKATVTTSSMRLSAGDACGESCFRYTNDGLRKDANAFHWENQDVQILQDVLKVTPDLISCDLATICRKPCREVWAYRSQLITDDGISQARIYGPTPRILPNFADILDNGTWTPLHPCHHKGPCDQTSGCTCFRNSHHCQRNCRCEFDCRIRWTGCKCKKKKQPCSIGMNCVCLQNNRECEPDVCGPCGASFSALLMDCITAGSRNRCQNVQIQRGVHQRLVIQSAEYGVGAFAGQNISVGSLVGDYPGHVVYSDSPGQSFIHDYTHRNYVFDLNLDMYVDGGRAGNMTRFLNHSSSPNCYANVFLVNGEHRVGIFAEKNINRGDELFLNYGKNYWLDGMPE